jgi:hypothetical protein
VVLLYKHKYLPNLSARELSFIKAVAWGKEHHELNRSCFQNLKKPAVFCPAVRRRLMAVGFTEQ